MSFPVSFKEFIKDPIKAMLFLCLIAIMYLYIDNKMGYVKQIEKEDIRATKQDVRISELEEKVEDLQQRLIDCASQ